MDVETHPLWGWSCPLAMPHGFFWNRGGGAMNRAKSSTLWAEIVRFKRFLYWELNQGGLTSLGLTWWEMHTNLVCTLDKQTENVIGWWLVRWLLMVFPNLFPNWRPCSFLLLALLALQGWERSSRSSSLFTFRRTKAGSQMALLFFVVGVRCNLHKSFAPYFAFSLWSSVNCWKIGIKK